MTRVAGVRVMYVHASGHSPRFADRVEKMLERVEHRPAMCQADRKAAYRLRYEAYLRENLLNQRLDAMLYDEVYDASPNSLTTVTYVDGELASTVRVHVITDKEASFAGARCVSGRGDALSASPAGPYRPLAPCCARGHGKEISRTAVLRPPPAVDGGALFQCRLHRFVQCERT